MGDIEPVDLTCEDEEGNVGPNAVIAIANQQNENNGGQLTKHQGSQCHSNGQVSEENIISTSSGQSTCNGYSGVSEVGLLPVDETGLSYSAPLCRKFWKAGDYDNELGSKVSIQNSQNYLHVHPLFLHSNATSHKWAFGAIAELLDNAVDEIQNGATCVFVDKILNPKDGSPALLIQDDGGGMDPEAMLRCMSFGFSDKSSNVAIGQYGNGFKTGSMRAGADVIVFSRHVNNMILTQSIGLLSYTFLMRKQLDRIVVPMVNYRFGLSTGYLETLNGREHFTNNMSTILQWSPYSSEVELLKQFDDIGYHGTKIVIFNLWFNDDGNCELDFDTDPEDIRVAGDIKKVDTIAAWKTVNEEHTANRFHYSLRVYLSILYLRIPDSFRIILRGKVVQLHNIADDLKYTEVILYRPHGGGSEEGTFVTTIGFLKGAPEVNIHGFNIYHRNRLILPFWQVVNYTRNRGRGVVGVLRADCLKPTHNKQDFERSSLFQKLEVRLRDMTCEYWDYHCHLLGYYPRRMPRAPSLQKSLVINEQAALNNCSSPIRISNPQNKSEKASTKSWTDGFIGRRRMKRKRMEDNVTGPACNQNKQVQPIASHGNHVVDQRLPSLMEVNKNLREKCSAFEKTEEELNLKVTQLRSKIQEAQLEYVRLLAEVTVP